VSARVAVDDPDFTLHVGDARDVLPQLPSGIVDCVVSSPPFYGLRDYGVESQIGLEATPDEWVASLVAVFRECRRLLKPAGVMWVECGDSYGTSGGQGETGSSDGLTGRGPRGPRIRSVKPKDLLGQPWLLAFALRADGWYLRQCVIWHKPNAMPESVRDRCTTAHSYVFLLSKSPRYWFDADAIAEPAGALATRNGDEFVRSRENREAVGIKGFSSGTPNHTRLEGAKNARSVWTIPPAGYPDAHFATFPEALVERMLKAGCPEQVCASCGKARERVSEQDEPPPGYTPAYQTRRFASATGGYTRASATVGWSDCGCGAGFTPGVVLDPFMGSGTTALVARRLGRKAIGVELSPAYAAMAARRTDQLSLLA
jgi:DNA modification methylase